MAGKKRRRQPKRINEYRETAIGTVRKKAEAHISVALVYPNHYGVGMSNLGFQTVLGLFNSFEGVVCERAFLPNGDASRRGISTVESGRSIADFDLVAFSVSFENDYPNVLTICTQAGLPLYANDRSSPLPLLLAGGVTCLINPEPIAPFMDLFLIGEAEGLLPAFMAALRKTGIDSRERRTAFLRQAAANLPGVYVPSLYQPRYDPNGRLDEFDPSPEAPPQVRRVYLDNLSTHPTCSVILTPDTIFDDTFLLEVSRGCPHGCRFCSAGYIYRPPRFRDAKSLSQEISRGSLKTHKIGLVGAAVSDLPELGDLCARFKGEELQFSFSSLRVDALTPELIGALQASGVKTATIAPDAGSERMRRVVNKGVTEEEILAAVDTLVTAGIPNLKLYFMVGLPTEEEEDVDAIVALCIKVKEKFLAASRNKGKIGEITVSLNCFVPKPTTPFQWAAMDNPKKLKTKIKRIQKALRRVPNMHLNAEQPARAYVQGLLSRGDRRVAEVLLLHQRLGENWPQTLKNTPVDADAFILRKREKGEVLPWDFIDHGVKKSYLWGEYQRALKGKPSPPCSMETETCRVCGVCRTDS